MTNSEIAAHSKRVGSGGVWWRDDDNRIGLVGASNWLLPDARTMLGSNAFLGLTALSIAGGLVGLATWYQDRE